MIDSQNNFENRIDLSFIDEKLNVIRNEISKVIIGQDQTIDLIINSIFSDGHILIEGVPGVAKTLIAKIIAKCINVDFKRIQFTPDLMPSDVIGTSIFNPKNNEFELKKGPAFTNLLLIDEINRAPAKTQSALFEIMQERQITIDGKTHLLDEPFIVIATQNPVEHEGTYRLPEAQLDRFFMKINVSYPNFESERSILSQNHKLKQNTSLNSIESILNANDIIEIRDVINNVIIDDSLIDYTAQFIKSTRESSSLYLGASPRAGIALLKAAKTNAVMNKRDFITPDDIIYVASHTISHRVLLTPEKELEGINSEEVINEILHSIEVPR